MRATSSMRSASRVTSARRKAGGRTSRPSSAPVISNSRERRISALRWRGISRPSSPATRASRSRITAGSGPGPPTSIVPGTRRAPVSSTISAVETACAHIACSGWICFSKRPDASLRSARRRDVRWMLGPTHVAASIRTRVVASETSERWPPITPAIDVGPSPSSITTISASSVRSTSSSVVTFSPSFARRTTRVEPATLSRSKACSGWPVEQHHVVGDVDHVGDRALARGHQARLQPRRRGADLHVLEHPRGEARAQLRDLDADLHAGDVAVAPGILVPRRG